MKRDKMMRANTEYIRSPKQLMEAAKVANGQGDDREAQRLQEVQRLVDMFRDKLEDNLDEDLEDFTVVEFGGDLTRKVLAKVRIGEEEFVHLRCTRGTRSDRWMVRYLLNKSSDDDLLDEDADYVVLREQGICGSVPEPSCNTKECIVM